MSAQVDALIAAGGDAMQAGHWCQARDSFAAALAFEEVGVALHRMPARAEQVARWAIICPWQ